MKMRLKAFLAFALLSISILSYGVSGSAFAENHDIGAVQKTLSIFLDTDIIGNGGIVTISGNIKNYDPSSLTAGAITYLITSPDNNIVGIGQLAPLLLRVAPKFCAIPSGFVRVIDNGIPRF